MNRLWFPVHARSRRLVAPGKATGFLLLAKPGKGYALFVLDQVILITIEKGIEYDV